MGCGVALKNNMVDISAYQGLSRKDRRKKERELGRKIPANPLKNPAWVEENRADIVSEAAFKAWVEYYALHMIVMHDKFGYGKQRLEKVFVELAKMYDHIKADRVTPQELKDALQEETGIDLNDLINKYHELVIGR